MNKRGFTLIEVMVVTGIISMVMPVIFAVVFAVLREEARVYALRTVKNQGDFVLNNLKYNIRNFAISIHSAYPAADANKTCTTISSTPTAINPLVLRDRSGNSFYYSLTSGAMASNSSVLASPVTLNDSKVSISNLTLSCNKPSQFSAPVITISYTVTYVSSAAGDIPPSFTYQTKIKLRNQ